MQEWRMSVEKKRKASPVRKWGPASDAWLTVFGEVSAGLGESRKMFGYPCTFVNGNMFAGLHGVRPDSAVA